MNSYIPMIMAAGEFDSRERFSGLNKSPLRRVDCFELEYYFEDGGFSEINGRLYPMLRGNILVARPDDIRRSTLPFKALYIHFTKVSGDLEQILKNLPPIIEGGGEDDKTAFLRIATLFLSAAPADCLAAAGELLCLISKLDGSKRRAVRDSEDTAVGDIIGAARRYIELHFSEDITVEMIAESCHISASYLHRIFAESIGVSPHTTLLNRRITAAKTLLSSTALPLGEISAKCGFNSQGYFCDCFKRKTGVSPSVFRKNSAYNI